MSTSYHAKYFAHEITRRRPPSDTGRLSMSLFDAAVDLNPHQIDAALFALQSPLAKGVLLADEVGLGKTIEAGLVLCQMWAERRRRLLVICPASIRKQWAFELAEKFSLPTVILDMPAYRQAQRDGNPNPFHQDAVVVTSLHFASAMQGDVRATQWDMVAIDEAHKLRNAHRPANQMGQRLRWALADRRKVLLTATPLQNSLVELYGISTVLDEHLFGDLASFRSQYMRSDSDLRELRGRLRGFCQRTLRDDVAEYVRYTRRQPFTREFSPTDDEHRLYEAVSAFLMREDTYAIPAKQRSLTTLILRKLLASSSHAIAGTLATMRARLLRLREDQDLAAAPQALLPGFEDLDEDLLEEEAEERAASEGQPGPEGAAADPPLAAGAAVGDAGPAPVTIDLAKLNAEIEELGRYETWARGIGVDTKSRALLKALEVGFAEMQSKGAGRKALVFTESRRTQDYLRGFLEANGYAGKVVLFNGTNTDEQSDDVYQQWLSANAGNGRVTGSRPVDIRTALVEHFRDHADVMIATEAAAEGVNLQFCSLVVNYDLPWNPQRIEQRIGRCHRYGQRHDVVVVNFLNQRNAADRRVLELLTEKFRLFSGVFGASDEVIGTVESGVDFEKRILAIYQCCRTPAEIDAAFEQLRREMDASIRARMEDTHRKLLEHFDEDVHARLRLRLEEARQQLDQVGRLFWALTKFMLRDHATFEDGDDGRGPLAFDLHTPPRPDIKRGRYVMISKTQLSVGGEFVYRLSHPLGEYVVEAAKAYPCPAGLITFDISRHRGRIAAVEALRGQAGWLLLQRLEVESFDREEYLLFSAVDDAGRSLDQEACEKLFRCEGVADPVGDADPAIADRLRQEGERHVRATIARSLEENNRLFQQEREKLDRWAADLVAGAEKELNDCRSRLQAAEREVRLAPTMDEQHAAQQRVKALEGERRRLRANIFDVEDSIRDKRDSLIASLEARMGRKTSVEPLFMVRWQVK